MTASQRSLEDNFIERLGLLVESEGLPRIAGRIMGYLILATGPCKAADLAERLQVSHGSISTNTRLLEQLGMVERTSFPGDRNSYFRLTDDPYVSLLNGHVARMRRIHALVEETLEQLPTRNTEARSKLTEMEKFYRLLTTAIESVVSKLSRG